MKMFVHLPSLPRYPADTQEIKTVNSIVETHTYTQYEVIYLKTTLQGKRQFLHFNEGRLSLRGVK